MNGALLVLLPASAVVDLWPEVMQVDLMAGQASDELMMHGPP